MNTFRDMGISPTLANSLEAMNITTPTPIQALTIPLALQEKDILGSAQTGTGKTLAFIIPLLESLVKNPTSAAMVLTPTRELAQQILSVVHELLGKSLGAKTVLLIGGEPIGKQLHRLRTSPRIIVGTPGRVIDHLERKTLNPRNIQFLVLDETDRMLDMGFDVQLQHIIARLPKQRQTLMFSATLPSNIIKLANTYLLSPERVSVGSVSKPSSTVTQEIIHVTEAEKYEKLVLQLNQREGSIIVFVKTKIGAEDLADKLCQENHGALAIHGDLHQRKREKVISTFRNGSRHRILVATDVVARGLDIPHIKHVINYDIPECFEDYIHRIGRTGRLSGTEGFSLSLVTPRDTRKWKVIHANLHSPITEHGERFSFERSRKRSKGFQKSRSDKGFFANKPKRRGYGNGAHASTSEFRKKQYR